MHHAVVCSTVCTAHALTTHLMFFVLALFDGVQESGNPAVDDLRERVAELAGIDLVDFLEEGKGSWGGGQALGGKGKTKVQFVHVMATSTGAFVKKIPNVT